MGFARDVLLREDRRVGRREISGKAAGVEELTWRIWKEVVIWLSFSGDDSDDSNESVVLPF
jgi:hypothetical protein